MSLAQTSQLILVRHGETTGESSIRLNGRTDVPLSDLGRRQGDRVGAALAGLRVSRILVSPLVRSQQMARHVWPRVKPRQEIFPGFLEIDFGDWETLTVGEVEERFPEAYARWKSTRDRFRYPGGESVPEFRERIARTARELFAVPGKGVTLAVLHKGVIKGVLAALLDQSFDSLRDYSVELGSIHRLSARKGSWLLESPGEVDHLGDDRSPEAILPEEKEDP